ncbi:MAG: FAD-dependent oxidoreductase, partial [Pseudonocardia sp.]|nr:FAD-dependent oxidoreductase [Pseudonocardia sp.]
NVDVPARKAIGKDELHRLMAEAADHGYRLPRREGSDHITPVRGMTATVMTRVESVRREADGGLTTVADPVFYTAAEIAGRRQALEYARFLADRVPGYADAALIALSTQIGVRETRRVYGDYRVTREDVLAARQFDDQIGLCGAPVEDHHPGADTAWEYLPEGTAVGIPLRSLIVRDAANVLVAGRCFSATHGAHASIRSMAQCMAMGQAAGVAAGLAAGRHGGEVREAMPHRVRDTLRDAGAILEVPEGVAAR